MNGRNKFMKKLLILLSLLFTINVYSQSDIVVIKHDNYTTTYSTTLKYPLLVEWWVTKAKCLNDTLKRKDQFGPDPKLPNETDLEKDYKSNDYKTFPLDRGHMCPAADNLFNKKVETECFYFSNMAPQFHSLNAGDWKTIETYTRDLSMGNDRKRISPVDSIHVWAGSLGRQFKIGQVTVPAKCWKVLYIPKTKQWHAYLMVNCQDKPLGFANIKEVNVSDIEKLTGFKFKK